MYTQQKFAYLQIIDMALVARFSKHLVCSLHKLFLICLLVVLLVHHRYNLTHDLDTHVSTCTRSHFDHRAKGLTCRACCLTIS